MSTTRRNSQAAANSVPTQPQTETSGQCLQHVKTKLRNITNTIRMSSGDESPARKKKKSDPNPIPECSRPAQPELIAFDKLRLVLGRHYFDVCQRLALYDVPKCVRNTAYCAQWHVDKRSPRVDYVDQIRSIHTLDQIRESRPDQFIEFLNQAIMRQKFIDSTLFLAGLQLMLTLNHPSPEMQVEYGIGDTVIETGEALEKLIKFFPPCRWDLRSTYQQIVFGTLDAQCFKQLDKREGLFRNLLHLIECNIETEQKPLDRPCTSKRTTKSGHTVEDDEFSYNYNSWMLTNRLCYDYNKLSREDQLQRLFIVLDVLVKLLEMDFAIWILRYPTKTQQNICNPSRCPLVAQLVWNGDNGSVNLFIKKLFQIFINMNALQYPEYDIDVISRLLHIITVAVNLSEFQHNEGQIQYPCVKDNSLHYARQLWKTLESSGYFSIALCLSTIRNLRSPFLQLHLAQHLLQKFNRSLNLCNVRSFFQQLLNRSWLDYPPDEPAGSSSSPSASTYPVLNTQRTRTKTCEMCQKQYVDLLLIGLRAYCDMHQLPAYFREIMVQPAPSASSTIDATLRAASSNSNECPPNGRIVRENSPDERKIFKEVAISAELVLEYRDDIKYLLLIGQQLKALESTEEKALFHDWMTFLSEEVDPSLSII